MILGASDPSILVIFLASKIQPEFQCAFSWNIMDFWWKLVSEKQGSNEKKLKSEKPWETTVVPMFFGDLDSQNLIGNRDFHYQKLSNKLSGFHSRIQVSVGQIFLTFEHHFHFLGHPFDLLMDARGIPLPILAISFPLFGPIWEIGSHKGLSSGVLEWNLD